MFIEVKLRPWVTPNFVSAEMPTAAREDGFKESPKWHISELEEDQLSELCDQFRKDIFAKAGKIDPKLK